MKDLKVGDIVKFTGKTINSVTYGKEYIIIEIDRVGYVTVAIYLDDNNNKKTIVMTVNKWRSKFQYVSNIRKEKLKKLNEAN